MGLDEDKIFDGAEQWRKVATNLSRLDTISRYNTKEDDESWTLSHDFSDLESSFLTLLRELFPKLLNDRLPAEDLEDLLIEIGEEFRHILYHIGNNRFYEYLGIEPDGHGSQD